MACCRSDGFDQLPWRRVCWLVHGSLRHLDTPPFSPLHHSSEKSPTALTKESERALLVCPTAVFREIQQWTSELADCISSQVTYYDDVSLLPPERHFCHAISGTDGQLYNKTQPEENRSFSDGGSDSSQSDTCNWEKGHSCLADVVSLLVTFSVVENSFVRHSTGKILVAIFDFFAKSNSNCVDYILCLWLTLKELFSLKFCPSQPPKSQDSINIYLTVNQQLGKAEADRLSEGHSFDHAHFATAIRQRLIRPSYSMVTHIIEVLFTIVKIAKADYPDLMETNIHLSISVFSSVAWESLDGKAEASEPAWNGKIGASMPAWLFFGALLRILCSLADRKDLQEEESALDELSVYSKLTCMVHRILSCCFSHCKESYDTRISHYLKHKSMMLIMRLGFGTQWKCPFALLWLDFLEQFCQDLLLQPISKCQSRHGSSLEGSPFLVIYDESISVPCICHLQRQAIFLFLKCCVTLVSPSSGSNNPGCCCATSSVLLQCKAPVISQKCSEKGLDELYPWIRRQSSFSKYIEHGFSMSLLQLYMDEDDMLFEMLLLLSDTSLPNVHEHKNEISGLFLVPDQDVDCISSVFNPINLFHLFLLMLHYDHSVLLDYLISKDVGIQCVRYLLRCLRIVCRSWSIFAGFYMNENSIDSIACPSEERLGYLNQRREGPRYKRQKIENESFENAKQCLLSLKSSVEDLHRKKIFPYNPRALLKAFLRFEELCQINASDRS